MTTRHRSLRLICGALALACGLGAQAAVSVTDPPTDHSFGSVALGAAAAIQYFSLTNDGASAVVLGQARIDGELATCAALGCSQAAADDFTLASGSDGCSGMTLAPGAACSLLVSFTPSAPGGRTARLTVPVTGEATVERILSGTGRAEPFDCVMDWAERTYPQLLTTPTATFVYHPFYARCYANDLCVGADVLATVAAPSIYLQSGGALNRYEYLSALALTAGCR